ncbi:MAG: tetratricopeptide repeat protein [Chitinivibrionales bacterium]|nr:tetratricopeptide repeat protein [Chitinivibrionales bacterium]
MPAEEIELHLEGTREKLAALRSAYESNPNSREAAAALARLYTDLGWFNQAADIYQQIMETFPDDFSLLLDYGNILVRRDELDEAHRIFKKLTVVKPGRVEGWNNLGIVSLKKSENDAARDAFMKVLEIEPDNAGALLNMGNYYHMRDETGKAIEFFNKAVAAKPDFADGWFNLGNALITQCEYEKAIAAYKKALRYAPEFGSAEKNIGFACERLGRYEEAEKHYSAALSLNRADGGIYINLANVYTVQGKLDKAKERYLKAVRLSPREPAGWMGLRELALTKGDIRTYVRATYAVVRRLGSDAIAESLAILRRLKRYDMVDELCAQADAAEKHGVALDAERLLVCQRKEPGAAKTKMILKKLLAVPDPPTEVACVLAEYHLQEKQYEKAYKILQNIFDDDLLHNILIWRALIYLKRWDNAEETINAYLKNHPDCPECLVYLARIKVSCNDRQAAESLLMRALEHGLSDMGPVEEDPVLDDVYRSMISGNGTAAAG